MRLIKMFGLAAIAVGALMAFVGASSAMAVTELEEVVICKAKEDPCLNGSFGAGTVIDGELVSGTHATLLGGSAATTILCTTSATKGEIAAGQTLAHGLITGLSFGPKCTREGEECKVKSEHLPYLWLVLLTEGHKEYHLVVTEHGTNGLPQAHVTCGLFVNCTFKTMSALFEVLLDEVNHDVVLDIETTLEKEGEGFLCPEKSVWQAKYLARCLEGTVLVGCWPKME